MANELRLSRAIEHGRQAYGARWLKSGFSFSADEDLLFALGWPHLRLLTEDHPAGVPLSLPIISTPWPTNFAPALTRGLAKNWLTTQVDAAQLDTLRFGQPLTEAEASELLRERFLESASAHYTGQLLLAIEALHGPALVVSTVVSALEEFREDRQLTYPVDLDAGIFMLGFVLLRASEATSCSAAQRLQRIADAKTLPLGMTKHIDLILNGRAGAERSGQKIDGKFSKAHLQHITDDPAFVAGSFAQAGPPLKHEVPIARLAFLGGDALLEHESKWWQKYAAKGGPLAVIDAYGSIRSPQVVAMMAAIAHKSKAKKQALAWMVSHREYAEPILREQAKTADAATSVLKMLG